MVTAASAEGFVPSRHLDFSRGADAIRSHCGEALSRARRRLSTLAALSAPQRTFRNTPWALDLALYGLQDDTSWDTFAKYVSVSSGVRAAANDCEVAVGKFLVGAYTRPDLYRALREYAERRPRHANAFPDGVRGARLKASTAPFRANVLPEGPEDARPRASTAPPLPPEETRLLEKELLDFKRNGLALSPGPRAEVARLLERLVGLEAGFGRNLNEAQGGIWVSSEKLAGLPSSYVAKLKTEGGRSFVTLDYPDYFPFMSQSRSAEARRRLEFLFDNRAWEKNLPILEEALRLRRREAGLLGFGSYADYALQIAMARKPSRVLDFLNRLTRKLRGRGREEIKALLALEGSSHDLTAWNFRFDDNLLRNSRYGFNQDEIKRYFPLETVLPGMLRIFERLLGVRFQEIPNAAVWHPDVRLFEIKDSFGTQNPVIGYFYLDLFPRPGKYKHGASYDVIKGRLLPDGGYQKPVSALVVNFAKPAPGNPSYLRFGRQEEVETLFHEFGHIMHQTLTTAAYGRFSGSSVARDFVEAPSQLFENWSWEPEVIAKISGKDGDRRKPLPPDLQRKLLGAKNADIALLTLRQVFFSAIDMDYHAATPPQDPTAAWARDMKRIMLIPMAPGTHPEASFGHLMGGYAAGYYGYLWSRVYAQDMFGLFKKRGIFDEALGLKLRRDILEKGSSEPEEDLLEKFLGRAPNDRAFLASLGVNP